MMLRLRALRVFQLLLALGMVAACAIDSREPAVVAGNDGGAGASNVITDQGAVLPQAMCEAGQYQCRDSLLQTCADNRLSWLTVDECAGAALCQAEPPGCLAPVCGEGEMTCAGAVLQRCNADRSGWDVFATCESPAHCNAEGRQCTLEPCTPGERRCDRSDADQSPVLEACRADRLDWDPLDACATPELCNETLRARTGGLVVSDGVPVPAPPAPAQVTQCSLPACAAGEVSCDGQRLMVCAPSRVGFELVEECATPALCESSKINVGANGKPACLPPACAPDEHLCSETGVLSVCNEDRAGFRVIQSCIGPAYCNATLADQGQEGCRATPCVPGQMQCNGAQIQICRADSSGLDDFGAACESSRLCNADDPSVAVCDPPSCHRGPVSGDEFRCDGASLQRCNEALTGYDTVETCLNSLLCDASQRLKGCRPALCQPGEHTCTAGVLQTCKADLTGFEDTMNCGSQAGCDSSTGQCVAACEPGTLRCNAQSGDLEECNLDTGWRTVADCLSLALCDVENRRCNPPLCEASERSCEMRDGIPVIVECTPGRDALNVTTRCEVGQICDAQNNECDVCTLGAVSCEGDDLVTCDARGQSESRQTCGVGLCSAEEGRCLSCGPIGSARCTDRQLLVCTQDAQGEFEASESCATDELCAQTLQTCGSGLQGQNCQCNPGTCRAGQVLCNGAQVQRCNEGLTGFDTLATCSAGNLCNAATADCNTCVANEYSCANGQLRQCANDGRSFARTNINLECASANQLRVCNGGAAGVQNCPNGCTNGRGCNQCTGNGIQCINGNTIRRCVNGFFQDQPCQFGCNNGATSCNACQGNGSSCINNGTARQTCTNGQLQTQQCPLGCVNGQCANCNGAQCQGDQIRDCNNGQLAGARSCEDGNICNGVQACRNNRCEQISNVNCFDGDDCTEDVCIPGTGCRNIPNQDPGCACSLGVCDANGSFLSCDGGQLSDPLNCAFFGLLCRTDAGCTPSCSSAVCNFCAPGTEGAGCFGGTFYPCINGAQGVPQQCSPDQSCSSFGCN